jgi:hypothetical protein
MKKIIWIIVAIAVGLYFVHSYMAERAEREAKEIEAKRLEQAVRSQVAEMVARTGAADDWEPSLSKVEQFRLEPILTVELERLWLLDRPILFIGTIKDVATHDQSRYIVTVERSHLSNLGHMFSTELQLSLLSSKEKIDAFLREHPDLFKNFGLNNSVAVVARINGIRTLHVSGEEGQREEIKVGDGDLVEIVYAGHILFRNITKP